MKKHLIHYVELLKHLKIAKNNEPSLIYNDFNLQNYIYEIRVKITVCECLQSLYNVR